MLTLKNIHIKSFRSLVDLDIPLQNLSIFIGKNNAGKSNVLLAIRLLLEASTKDISEDDFYKNDAEQADSIEIIGEFVVPPQYLDLCDLKHRTKIQNCISDNILIVRRLITRVEGKPKAFPLEVKQPESGEYSTPTGIDAAFRQFLPEVIFIEAFKDPSEESKAKGTAVLGKILKQIVEQVSSKISDDVMSAISEAAKKFNQIVQDGQEIDDRPDELKRVESGIRSHIQDIFSASDVRLRFNLPNVTDLISTATIELKDCGPWTSPDGKGQGFQRVLYVALLQTLADELRDKKSILNRPFILLYEEPEAFLHPALQREVGNIIEKISNRNQVIVASHSPILVNPTRLENIVILRQALPPSPHRTNLYIPSPSLCECDHDRSLISLLKLNHSSEFLFSDYILVVEGVSDRFLFESSWEKTRSKLLKRFETIAIIESGGKDIVPVWIEYLKKMGFPAKGCVDLDFLWKGAGKILKSDIGAKFCEKFWHMSQKLGYCEVDHSGKIIHSIRKCNKRDTLRLVIGDQCDQELNKLAETMCLELKKYNIWVLTNGEIEDYFGLTPTSKTEYVSVGYGIRSGQIEVPNEIQQILLWLFD